MSEINWESLRPELQTALRTLAEGRRIDSALENELEDLGLAEYVQGAHATWATDKGYALLPAGKAVDVPAVKLIPPHATLLQDLQSVAMGEIEDNPVANIAMSALNLIKLLKSEHAAALARAQAAEGEVARLEAVVSRKQVVIESHWKTIERASKRCALLKSAAHDVYDMCFENDDQKQVRHLRRVLKVLGTKLYRSPNGD